MRFLGLLYLGVLLTTPACFDRTETAPPPASCTSCHGDATSAAPPNALGDLVSPTQRGVGVHRAHLDGAKLGRPVACQECHVVPSTTDAPGHIDTPWPAEVTWGPVTRAGTSTPTWDPATLTCAGTWCHGADTPVWTAIDGVASACGTCHALPPAAPHPPNDACEDCHAPSAGPGMSIASPAHHVDGVVDLAAGCTTCHGQGEDPAPPFDLRGGDDTSSVRVGAHQSHLSGGAFSKPVLCIACHVEVPSVDAPGHIDTPWPAEVVFADIARAGSSTATWDREAATCNTYCHGTDAPVWTVVDGTEAACGTCHALPPPAPHPDNPACETCHPNAGPGQTITAAAQHVDGNVDLSGGCTVCHGDTNPAPPFDLRGDADTTSIRVGAHQSHLSGGVFSKPVVCEACHLEVATVDAPGHIDTPWPAEVTFGDIATGGAGSSWDRDNATCASSCHGDDRPTWTVVDGTEAACGTCHALPPPAPHPPLDNCEMCHPTTAGPNQTIVNRTTHVDGTVDF